MAQELLLQCRPIIAPCDTIYGFLGIVPQSDLLIRQIKGREEIKPFLRLISDPDISSFSNQIIPDWVNLYWPGPLTLIVKLKDELVIDEKSPTVAIRYPNDPWLLDLLKICGQMLYSTSVNRAGEPALNQIDSIISEFGDEVDLIIDGGNINGDASTIIDLSSLPYRVLRQGSLFVNPEYLI